MAYSSGYCAVVPAAGIGRRFGGPVPKQYASIHGATVVEHTLRLLLSVPQLASVVVALHADDTRWRDLAIFKDTRIQTVTGGAERSDSVAAGLAKVPGDVAWVLVHDVARPCCPRRDIERLLAVTADHPVGGLLALPVSDTLKRATAANAVAGTVDRNGLWQAQTPQLFRRALLQRALAEVSAQQRTVTDEAQAVEGLGYAPLLVEGSRRNLKITSADDLALAAYYLKETL